MGAICALLPVIIWFIVQFGPGDTLGSIFSYYANPSGKASLIAAVMANAKGMFHDMSTLYTLGIMFVWAVGVWLRRRLKEKIAVIEIIAFIFSILIILAFLRTEGWYRYLFQAQIVALLFFPYSLSIISRSLKIIRAYEVGIILLAFLGVYQLGFRSWVAEAYASDKTAFWEEYFSHVPPTTSVLFDNTPEVVPFIHHRNYYQFISCAAGQFGTEQLKKITSGAVDMVVVRTDEYQNDSTMFVKYVASTEAYKYTILVKK